MVKTKLGLSKIQGVGLFADEDIPEGTIVYKTREFEGISPDFLVWSEAEWEAMEKNLSKDTQRQIKRHAYKYREDEEDEWYIMELDNTKFINHSDFPNLAVSEAGDIAVKDIKSGEEILIDYKTFYDPAYFEEIIKL